MSLWGYIVMAVFVFVGISILYYCCTPNRKVRTERWNRLRRRRREGERDPVEPTVTVYTINTPQQNSAGNTSNGTTERQIVVRSDQSNRPVRARANSESDLPPSYAEAVTTVGVPDRSARRGRERPNRY